MNASRRSCLMLVLVAVVLASTPYAVADIYQWDWVDPANPGLGRQASTTFPLTEQA